VKHVGPGSRMIHVKHRFGSHLDGPTVQRLGSLHGLLQEQAIHLGLVAPSDAGRLWERHILDCLRATALLQSGDGIVCDIGSGAGLPGLVLACARPELRVTLVDSRRRAAAFLELAVDRLALTNVDIRFGRVEKVSATFDVATARAFGPLPGSWEAAVPLLRPGGRLIYFGGEGMADPEGEAGSITAPEPPAAILVARVIETSGPLVIMSRKG